MKGQNNFWWQNAFLTGSWRFFRCNKSDYNSNLKKLLGFRNIQETLENILEKMDPAESGVQNIFLH